MKKASTFLGNLLNISVIIFVIILYYIIYRVNIVAGIIFTLIGYVKLITGGIFHKIAFSQSYEKYIKKICKATYKAFVKIDKIDRKAKFFVQEKDDNIEYGLINASTYEQMIYIRAIKQAISLDANTRYIIKSYNRICSVPDVFAKNKKEATMFLKNFRSLNKKLIFTKTDSGRKELLKGKIRSLI